MIVAAKRRLLKTPKGNYCARIGCTPSRSHVQASSTLAASKYRTLAWVNGLQIVASQASHQRSPTIAMRSISP